MNHPGELKYKLLLIAAENEVEKCKQDFFAIKKEVDVVETALVNAREVKIRAEEDLRVFQMEKVGENSLDEEKSRQVAAYRLRMPELLKSIENEKPIPYRTIMDLDTIKEWPKSKLR